MTDEGGRHVGVAAIRQWWSAAKEKYRHVAVPRDVRRQDGRIVVRARVSGDFPGSPVELDFSFELAEEKIRALEIR
ncbi:MAG: hypothetical protein ACOY4R_20435 [Pseudomonadota bacterium]